jgi:hypothetical protein
MLIGRLGKKSQICRSNDTAETIGLAGEAARMELFIVGGTRRAVESGSTRTQYLVWRSAQCVSCDKEEPVCGGLEWANRWADRCSLGSAARARWASRRGVMRGDQERRKWKEKSGIDPASSIAGNATRRFVEGDKRENEGEAGGGAGVERIWDGGWWSGSGSVVPWNPKTPRSDSAVTEESGGGRCWTQEVQLP